MPLSRPDRVSVITPTARHDCHESLYSVFLAQTHEDKQLVVCDDSPEPSPLFGSLRDRRVRYIHVTAPMSVGRKRDVLVREADGDVVMHFDDDDYYAPDYMRTMLSHLDGADLVKLVAWFCYDSDARSLFYWDTLRMMPLHCQLKSGRPPTWLSVAHATRSLDTWLERQLWGYGFSFVFRRRLYDTVTFDSDLHHGEDYAFCQSARRLGLRVKGIADVHGLALHVIHSSHRSTNMSAAFPNYSCPPFMLERLFNAEGVRYLERQYGPIGIDGAEVVVGA